jgi:preprotein translocase subunit YajC
VDPITIVMLAVLALLIFFMFRNSRKRQRDLAAMADRTQPGARVMTNFGLFGTIVEIDNEENQVKLEAAPGVVLTVHRQTIAKIIDANEVVSDDDAEAVEEGEIEPGQAAAPAYGERVADETGDTNAATPTRTPKKIDE